MNSQQSFIYKTLTDFGLSENEIKLYLEAIKHIKISPFQLAKLTGIPRTTVYDSMMNLSLKGLIKLETSKGLEKQQTWIVAHNPSILRDIVIQREKDLSTLEVHLVDILSDLKQDYLIHQQNTHIRYYAGIEGAKRVDAKIRELPQNSSLCVLDHLMPMDTLGKTYINAEVQKALQEQRKNNIHRKTIIPWNTWTQHVLSYQFARNNDYIVQNNFRFLDTHNFDLQQDMYIGEDCVYIVTAKKDEVWGAIINSRLFTSSLQSIFNVLWDIANPITKKTVEALGENVFFEKEKKKGSAKK